MRTGTTRWSLAMAAVLAHVVMTVAAGAVPLGRDGAGVVLCTAMGLRAADLPPEERGRAGALACYLCPACQTPTVTAGAPAAAPALVRMGALPAETLRPGNAWLPAFPAYRAGTPRGPPAGG